MQSISNNFESSERIVNTIAHAAGDGCMPFVLVGFLCTPFREKGHQHIHDWLIDDVVFQMLSTVDLADFLLSYSNTD